jgi:hypothetical protein
MYTCRHADYPAIAEGKQSRASKRKEKEYNARREEKSRARVGKGKKISNFRIQKAGGTSIGRM